MPTTIPKVGDLNELGQTYSGGRYVNTRKSGNIANPVTAPPDWSGGMPEPEANGTIISTASAPKGQSVSDIYKGLVPEGNEDEDSAYKSYGDILKTQMEPVNEADIRNKTLDRFQSEIDALEKIYAEKKQEEAVRGRDRLGSAGAIQSRRGLLGSDFGSAQTKKVDDYNQSIQKTIREEQAYRIGAVLAQARKESSDEITAKLAAQKQGAAEYLDFLGKSAERKNKRVADTVKSVLLSEVPTDDKFFDALAGELGVTAKQVKAIYNEQKMAQEASAAQAAKENYIKPETVEPGDGFVYEKQLDGSYKQVAGSAKDKELKTQVVEVGGSKVLINEATGEVIKNLGVVPQKSSDTKPTIVRVDGKDYTVDENGNLTVPTLPNSTPSADKVTKAAGIVSSIDALLNDPNLSKAIGPRSATIHPFLRSGERNDIDAKIDTLVANLALENLSLLKGPMSDKDVQFIKEASSGLQKNMSEAGFKKQLESIRDKFKEIKERAAIETPQQSVVPQSYIDSAREVLGREATQDEIKQLFPDAFNQPLSMGEKGSAEKIAAAIKQVESGGNYQIKGGSGENGAYQFMPATWKAWAKQYLGDANATMTPENQDKVAIAKINDLLEKGHSPKEIALIWNGGEAKVKKGVNKWGVAYDSGAYAQKVLKALG